MARSYKRDSRGRFSGGGSSSPKGTIAKGGKGVSGSVARSVAATGGKAAPNSGGQTPRLKAKAASKLVMKEGINSPVGSARAGAIKAEAAKRAANKAVSAAKKLPKGAKRDAALSKALGNQEKAQRNSLRAMDKLSKAARKRK